MGIAVVSLVLGFGVTTIMGGTGLFSRETPVAADAPYPTTPGVREPRMMGPRMMGPRIMGPGIMGRYPATAPACTPPPLPGTMVDVTLTDMGGMGGMRGWGWNGPYGPGRNAYQWPHMGMMGMMGMMRIFVNPTTVPAGQVSFRALNTGWLNHELVVLPLAQGQFPGQRAIGPDGKVDESGNLGEASRTCGAGKGDEHSSDYGIGPGTTGWTTITLPPGRYELICNIAGHYGAGMYAALDVVAKP